MPKLYYVFLFSECDDSCINSMLCVAESKEEAKKQGENEWFDYVTGKIGYVVPYAINNIDGYKITVTKEE